MSNKGEFHQHLVDAIRLNTSRKPFYAKMTNGRSKILSNLLIASEYLLLPTAHYYGVKARPFNKQGIGIVDSDFASMADVLPPETPPKYCNVASKDSLRGLYSTLKQFKVEALRDARQADFIAIAKKAEQVLADIKSAEESAAAHYAMSTHLVESIGISALHSVIYAKQSQQKTVPLSARLLKSQLGAISPLIVMAEKKIQSMHQLGAGIIVNEAPHIPFVSRYNEYLEGKLTEVIRLTPKH